MPYVVEAASDIEEGEYPADLAKIEDAGMQTFGPALRFVFNVYVEGEAEEVDALVSKPKRISDKTKLVKWAKTLLGVPGFAVGEGFELEDLVGKPCRVVIEINEAGYPKIVMLKSAARKKAGQPAVAAATAED